jgi:hypothetical protein
MDEACPFAAASILRLIWMKIEIWYSSSVWETLCCTLKTRLSSEFHSVRGWKWRVVGKQCVPMRYECNYILIICLCTGRRARKYLHMQTNSYKFSLSISGGHSHSILAVLTLQSNIMYSSSRPSSPSRGESVYRNEPSRSYFKDRHYLRSQRKKNRKQEWWTFSLFWVFLQVSVSPQSGCPSVSSGLIWLSLCVFFSKHRYYIHRGRLTSCALMSTKRQAHQHQQEPLLEIIQSAKRNGYVHVKTWQNHGSHSIICSKRRGRNEAVEDRERGIVLFRIWGAVTIQGLIETIKLSMWLFRGC